MGPRSDVPKDAPSSPADRLPGSLRSDGLRRARVLTAMVAIGGACTSAVVAVGLAIGHHSAAAAPDPAGTELVPEDTPQPSDTPTPQVTTAPAATPLGTPADVQLAVTPAPTPTSTPKPVIRITPRPVQKRVVKSGGGGSQTTSHGS